MALKQTIVTRVQPDSPGWYWYKGDNSKWTPVEVLLSDDGLSLLMVMIPMANRVKPVGVTELPGEWGDEIPLPKAAHVSSTVERVISPKETTGRVPGTRRPAIKAPEQSVIVPQQLAKFLYWISERHQTYLRRFSETPMPPTFNFVKPDKNGIHLGLDSNGSYTFSNPKPWTNDLILQSSFFCNPFRELDKTTQWFRENIRNPLRDDPAVIMATIIFRWFNFIPTGEALLLQEVLTAKGRKPKHDFGLFTHWDSAVALSRLKPMKKVFTGAHVVASGTQLADTGPREGGGSPKVRSICDHIDRMWEKREDIHFALCGPELRKSHTLPPRIATLQDAHTYLQSFPAIGDFQAYEIVSDLRHTYVLENAPDILTWANAGPGAKRGLNRIFGRPIGFQSPAHPWVKEMQILHRCCWGELLSPGPKLGKLIDLCKEFDLTLEQNNSILSAFENPKYTRLPKGHPPFELREVEHSLCEFDKYMRLSTPSPEDGGPQNPKRKYSGI